MRRATAALVMSWLGITGVLGCADRTPPPPRAPVPTYENRDIPITRRDDGMKPLPAPQDPYTAADVPPFDDPPLVSQQPPEQPAFLEAYRRVGSPRIVLFVNRTLEGRIVPVTPESPLRNPDQPRRDPFGGEYRDDRYEPRPPVDPRESDVYLRPGEYDTRSIDYEAIETIMTDWLSCSGQVTIISPTMARQRLTDQQVREIQEGRPQALSEIAQQLDADILVQVQARPTRQTQQGLEIRVIAEAMNIKGGQSVGRAVVDVPPPLVKTTINRYTRFMTRKLMDGMIGSWLVMPPPKTDQPAPPADRPPPPANQLPPTTQP